MSQWTQLQSINLGLILFVGRNNNGLTVLPEAVSKWTQLQSIDLEGNNLTALPEAVSKWTQLQSINLEGNKLTVLPEAVSQWKQLQSIYLSGNSELSGFLPVFHPRCDVRIQGTKLTIAVKTKKLKSNLDYFLVGLHVLLCYADLVFDVLAIQELYNAGRVEIAGLNISFLLLNVVLDVWTSKKSCWDILTRILQLSDLLEGYETLKSGRQTEVFVASKRIDAICRSLTSMVLHLYSLFLSISTITKVGYFTLMASIILSFAGMATTLASLSPYSGKHLFSRKMFLVVIYYLAEILLRVLIVTMLFVSIRAIGFVVIAVDFIIRHIFVCKYSSPTDFPRTIMWLGSDSALDKNHAWQIGSGLNSWYLFIVLVIINVLDTNDLNTLHDLSTMREHNIVRDVTVISCCAVTCKHRMYMYIYRKQEDLEHEGSNTRDTEKDKDDVGTINGNVKNPITISIS